MCSKLNSLRIKHKYFFIFAWHNFTWIILKIYFVCRSEAGHCRYLQHCILHDFIFSFDRFLQYVCFINGVWVIMSVWWYMLLFQFLKSQNTLGSLSFVCMMVHVIIPILKATKYFRQCKLCLYDGRCYYTNS